jgi:hypothetical protein
MGVDTLIYEYKDNKIINQYTKNDLSLEQFKKHIMHFESLRTIDDSITYWNDLNNYVFRIKDGKLFKRFLFDYGRYSYKVNNNKQLNDDNSDRVEHGTVESFIETKKYIFINSVFKRSVKHIFYDKKTKIASVIDNQLYNKNKLFNNFSFTNSFDGIVNFWPDKNGIINDSLLYRTFYAYDFKKTNFRDLKSDRIFNKNSILQKIIDESSYSDNPIIMIIKLKPNE